MNHHPLHNISGEQKDQFLITCDKNGNPIGEASREKCHRGSGISHLAFMAFVYDGNGNIWMTRRSKKKSLWGGYWDSSTISHVLPGETVEEATKRRGKEELGITVDFHIIGSFYYFAKFNGNCENEFLHILVGKSSQRPHPNPVEIEDIKKMPVPIISKEVSEQKNIYTPWLTLALEKIKLPASL